MDGVNIISKSEIVEASLWNYFALIFVISIVYCTFCHLANKRGRSIFILYGAIAALFAGLLSMYITMRSNIFVNKTGRYEYIVEVDDSVRFNEFYDMYTILDNDGNVYTVTEK